MHSYIINELGMVSTKCFTSGKYYSKIIKQQKSKYAFVPFQKYVYIFFSNHINVFFFIE